MIRYLNSSVPHQIENGPADVLEIRLLGGFEMKRGGAILSLPTTPKSRSLLVYLILNHGRLAHRETVCVTLWPDESKCVARKALRAALWRIRSALENRRRADDYIYGDAYQVGFRRAAPIWVDVWEFEEAVVASDFKMDEALDATDGERMSRAALLYHGNFGAGLYDEWIMLEQSRLEHAHLALLDRIARFHASHQHWPQAIGWAERALAVDPLREHLHRMIMSCHMSMGDRPSALRQFKICEAALKSELGIEPMAETQALLDSIHNPRTGQPLM